MLFENTYKFPCFDCGKVVSEVVYYTKHAFCSVCWVELCQDFLDCGDTVLIPDKKAPKVYQPKTLVQISAIFLVAKALKKSQIKLLSEDLIEILQQYMTKNQQIHNFQQCRLWNKKTGKLRIHNHYFLNKKHASCKTYDSKGLLQTDEWFERGAFVRYSFYFNWSSQEKSYYEKTLNSRRVKNAKYNQ